MDVQQLTFELQDNEMKVPVLHKEPHPLEKAVCDTACDFRELFQSLDFEEIHNHNSMAICGDCLKVLGQMKECSVHLIFADAPYNIGKNFGNNRDHWDTDEEYLLWCQDHAVFSDIT